MITNHMISLQVLIELYTIFGPELKGAIADPKQVDEALSRVDSLSLPFETISFDPFNHEESVRWKMIIENFNIRVEVSLG